MMNSESKKMSQITKSTEAVASNDDLLTKILLRLPIRSVLHFKSVSKHWLSLITNPRFSLLRSSSPVSPSGLFITVSAVSFNPGVEYEYLPINNETHRKPPFRSLTFAPDHFGIKILQSCNGLLFCSSSRGPTCYSNYYIYNPTTKQHATLPLLSRNVRTSRTAIWGMVLAFEPSKSPHYKVICVRGSGLGRINLYQIVIYSSQTRIWRKSGQPFMTETTPSFERGVYWNGAIHWANPPLYFQLEEERLEKMPLPPLPERYNEGCGPSYVGQSNGHLHFIETYGPGTTQLNVYEMRRDYSGWDVKYQVDLDEVPNVFPEMVRVDLDPTSRDYYALEVAHFVRREREEDSFLVLEIPNKALRYNIGDKSFGKVCDYPPRQGALDSDKTHLRYGGDCAYEYVESLSGV